MIAAAKIMSAVPQCAGDIFLRLAGRGASLQLPLPNFVRLMQFQRTLRRRLRAALAGVDDLYVIGVDGGELCSGVCVLGRRDLLFLRQQKKGSAARWGACCRSKNRVGVETSSGWPFYAPHRAS